MAKKPTHTSHKSRFETLEDRRLLTTVYNVTDPFTMQGSSAPVVVTGPNAGTYYYGGEQGFGDNATSFASSSSAASGYRNNNNDNGGIPGTASSAFTYPGGSGPVWELGQYTSGESQQFLTGGTDHPVTESFQSEVVPSTFLTYPYAFDGNVNPFVSADGEAGFSSTTQIPTTSPVAYTFGNNGLDGDGTGNPVADVQDLGLINMQIGTVDSYARLGPQVERFIAPTTGSYTISTTFTDPMFDPYNGPGGVSSRDFWTWNNGQPGYAVIKTDAGSSTILADGFSGDIASVNTAHLPTSGNSITTASNYLSINTNTGFQTNGSADSGTEYGGNLGASGSNYGSGGTWSLLNTGKTLNAAVNGHDTEWEMQWSYTQTITLNAGDTIDLMTIPIYGGSTTGTSSGLNVAPQYLAATVTANSGSVDPPAVTASGSTGQTFTVASPANAAVAVDSGLQISSSDSAITGASMEITNYQSGDAISYSTVDGVTEGTPVVSGSTLTVPFTGNVSAANYQAALRTVDFSTTSTTTGTRTIDVVATDSTATPTYSNTAVDSVNVEVAAPSVTASGSTGQTFTVASPANSAVAVDSGLKVSAVDATISGASIEITNYQSGDAISYSTVDGVTEGTPVVSGSTLTVPFTGNVSAANYQAALRTVDFSTTSTTTGTRTIDVIAKDSNSTPTYSNTAVDSVNVNVAAPAVTASGSTGQTFTVASPANSAVAVDSGLKVSAVDATITGASIEITNYQSGDAISYTLIDGVTEGTPVVSGSTLTVPFTGNVSAANYQAALRTVDFSTTSTTTGTRTIDVIAKDSNSTPTYSNTAVDSVNVNVAPPTVTKGTTGIYTVGGSAVAIDATLGLASVDTSLTGASVTINNAQTGDTLTYTIPGGSGITTTGYSGGVLTFSGTSSLANYQSVLQSVKFSSTDTGSTETTFRSVTLQANDSNATGNGSVGETVEVNPVVTQTSPTVSFTPGGATAVTVDSAATVFAGANLSSLKVIITNYVSGDTLSVGSPGSLTPTYSAGTLTLSGSGTAAAYQAALQSVKFSTTAGTTTNVTRTISMQAFDSTDSLTGNLAASDHVTVDAPVTITAVYLNSSSWVTSFDSYLGAHPAGGPFLGNATYGWSGKTGAAELSTLPWTTMNRIDVAFSGPVSNVGLASLELNGGSKGTTPTVTAETYLGNNVYQWTLSTALTNNQYVIGVASSSSGFGGANKVTDANGVGIDGAFTKSSSSFPSGNGAGVGGSTFDYWFNVVPGDANRDTLANSADITAVSGQSSGTLDTKPAYTPYEDLNGDGTINSADLTAVHNNQSGALKTSAPTTPTDSQVGGADLEGVELGVQESSPTTSSTTPVSNVIPTVSTPTVSPAVTSTASGSGDPDSTTDDELAATDEAVSEFDLADLYV